jgi:hypothetical protein
MSTNGKTRSPLIRCFVDGVVFELSEDLIQKRASQSLLACEDRRRAYYDSHRRMFVFDQSADTFEVLAYFISTGLLTRPMNVSNIKLYNLLCFFDIDTRVIETFKKMEHLACEIHWEKTHRSVVIVLDIFNTIEMRQIIE